mgnify:CR=1 FL=1
MNINYHRVSAILFLLLMLTVSACQSEPTASPTSVSTSTKFPTLIPSSTSTPTQSSELTAEPEPTTNLVTPTSAYTYPDSYYITDIVGHKQTYELGCEASAAVDWAGFFGVHIFESTFHRLAVFHVADHPSDDGLVF